LSHEARSLILSTFSASSNLLTQFEQSEIPSDTHTELAARLLFCGALDRSATAPDTSGVDRFDLPSDKFDKLVLEQAVDFPLRPLA
jgi:hypothetical protein